MDDQAIKTKVEKYLERAKPLYENLRIAEGLSEIDLKRAKKVLDATTRYYSDSNHFYANGEFLNALTALEYSEGWMDAGKELGLLLG